MRLSIRIGFAVCAVCFYGLCLLQAGRVSAQQNPAEDLLGVAGSVSGLRLPLGYHDNGQLKAQLRAEKAVVREGGKIFASNITSEFFTVEGKLDIMMVAEDCTYDKAGKTALSDGKVRLERQGVVITGRGYEWDSSNQVVCVTSDVRVVINRALINVKTLKGKTK